MSLKNVYTASRSAGLLPYVAIGLLIALLLASVGGTWFGMRWQKGSQALEQNKELADAAKGWREEAQRQRQAGVDAATAMRAATERMDAIAQQREQDREQINQLFKTQSNALRKLLERRPDLHRELGDDVLCHVNRSKAGPGISAAAAAALPGCQPAAAVPRPAATAGQQRGSVDRGRGQHRDDVSRLPQRQCTVDPGRDGMEGDRLGLVLRCGEAHGPEGRWVPGQAVT